MGAQPPSPPLPRTAFSPDGMWWWDGTQWRPAVSPDGRWRWDGRAWVPAGPTPARAGSGGAAALIAILAFIGVLVLVGGIVILILLTMGNQIANVFSNVAAALGASPSP